MVENLMGFTKELPIDRDTWKFAIHVTEFGVQMVRNGPRVLTAEDSKYLNKMHKYLKTQNYAETMGQKQLELFGDTKLERGTKLKSEDSKWTNSIWNNVWDRRTKPMQYSN